VDVNAAILHVRNLLEEHLDTRYTQMLLYKYTHWLLCR